MNVIRKKGSKGKKSVGKSKEPTPEKNQVPVINDDNEKPLDFGGIPARELKKNLGCG